MKKLSDFENSRIKFNNSSLIIGGECGCRQVDQSTYTVTGDGKDDMVTYYDDSGNEIGWEIQDPF